MKRSKLQVNSRLRREIGNMGTGPDTKDVFPLVFHPVRDSKFHPFRHLSPRCIRSSSQSCSASNRAIPSRSYAMNHDVAAGVDGELRARSRSASFG